MNAFLKLGLLLGAAFFAHSVLLADERPTTSASGPSGQAGIRSVGPAFSPASQTPPARQNGEDGPADEGLQLPPADLAGLRYFAQTGDAERYQKEVERLQALYPEWEPPRNLNELRSVGDPLLDQMWAQFGEGNYAQVRRLIDERRQAEPGWAAPQDLLDKLAAAEARLRLVNASDLKQFDTVIRIASQTPGLLTCADVDVIWRVAEAFADKDRLDRAKDAYLYILENCTVPSERIATIQKAIAELPATDVDRLLAEEEQRAGSEDELEAVRSDLVRLKVSRSLRSGTSADAADLARLETMARDDNSAEDATLLGWYFLEQEEYAASDEWFQRAFRLNGSEEAAQGGALALIGLGKPGQAEEKLRPLWQASDDNRETYLAAVSAVLAERPVVEIGADAFAAFTQATSSAQDANAAQEIGWYAYEIDQVQTASQWFELALSWESDLEPAAFGLALSLNRMNDRARLSSLVSAWSARSTRIAEIGRTTRVRGAASSTGAQGRGGGAGSTGCATFVSPATLSPGAAVSRGWCLLDKNRPLEAADTFAVGLTSGRERIRSEAAYGQSLAYLRIGLLNQAAVAATQASLPPARARELQLDLLSKRAVAAFEAGRYTETLLTLDERRQYAPEPFDLMELRGYAYLQMRRFDDALRVFETLAAAGQRSGQKGVATTMETRSAPPSIPGD